MATSTEIDDREELHRAARERRRPDFEVAKPVHERAAEVIEEIRRRGVTDLAVPLIREARD